MSVLNPDGPLRMSLKRSADKPAKFWLQRWKGDHPVTISLTVDELDDVDAAIDLARGQLSTAPQSGSAQSTLDLTDLLAIERAARQVG